MLYGAECCYFNNTARVSLVFLPKQPFVLARAFFSIEIVALTVCFSCRPITKHIKHFSKSQQEVFNRQNVGTVFPSVLCATSSNHQANRLRFDKFQRFTRDLYQLMTPFIVLYFNLRLLFVITNYDRAVHLNPNANRKVHSRPNQLGVIYSY